ncbi:proline--tRNA ligase [Campylobacterota bacterium]|nr:proline--tRNA ligase [Campylobacterota bacterium]
MRFSHSLISTLKESPKDAVLASHKYLIRGGFISAVAAGIYDLLPLGKRVQEKIRAIVKDELDSAGCQEVSLGFVTPAELWQESGRYQRYGKELLRFTDRKDGEFVLSPTNEEAMVNLVRGRVNSYKQLPLNLYQINTKFRDEARARFGLMRGREFLMKDGYSFHATHDDMLREFNLMEKTYKQIFTRLGLDFRVVEADSGAIGGSGSKEFMALSDAGEDTLVVCDRCEYGANIEAAMRQKQSYEFARLAFDGEIHTPHAKTIDEVSAFLNLPKTQIVKAVIKKALFDNGEKICLFFVRGSDELEVTKAQNSVGANELIEAQPQELERLGIIAGFVGIGFAHDDILSVIDSELRGETAVITGANRSDFHTAIGVPDDAKFADLIAVQAGDRCPKCGGVLSHRSGIEVGHIFQLGEKYSKPLNATFLDENGKTKPFVMGTYGIGVSRLIAAAIEQNHDEKGCIWSAAIAPYAVDLIVGNQKEEAQKLLADDLYSHLLHEKLETIYDDRAVGFGVKMNDYELIGFPFALIVGKNASDGKVEIAVRASGERALVESAQAVKWISDRLKEIR